MKRRPLDDVLGALAPEVWPALREEYVPNCCVAACRVLMRVFAHFGFNAEPIPVEVHLYNAVMVRLLKTGNPFPEGQQEKLRLWDILGAWGVGIVPESKTLNVLKGHEGGGLGGHVILRVKQYLVDPTLQQASRPEKNMPINRMVVTVHDPQFMTRTSRLVVDVSGVTVVYTRLNDFSFRTAPDWRTDGEAYKLTVHRIIERTEKRLRDANETAAHAV